MTVTEGLARSISPELIRALATAIPILVASWWILVFLGRAWRRAIWHDIGGAIEHMSQVLGGEVRPSWFGWAVVADDTRILWLGGLWGPRTVIRKGTSTEEHPGLLTSDALSDLHL
jgi:hypothetical protein